MDTIKFEWDENKNQTNQKKHGISFEEAKEVFFDDDAILFDDPEHSRGEKHETRIRHQKSEPQKKPVRKTAKTANHNKH